MTGQTKALQFRLQTNKEKYRFKSQEKRIKRDDGCS